MDLGKSNRFLQHKREKHRTKPNKTNACKHQTRYKLKKIIDVMINVTGANAYLSSVYASILQLCLHRFQSKMIRY